MRTQKKICKMLLGILGIALACTWLSAQLDTTTGPDLYKSLTLTTNYTFTDFELARGSVRFRNGFTVPAGVTATLDTYEIVSGLLDIQGTVDLAGNLSLDSTVTISSSGTIRLNGHTLTLIGDILLRQTFSIIGSPGGIIEGNDHRLTFSAGGLLKLSLPPDATTSVTLQNIRFEGCRSNNLLAPGYWGGNSPATASLSLNKVTFLAAKDQNFTLTADNIHMYRYIDFLGINGATMNLTTNASGKLFLHAGAELYIGPGLQLNYTGTGGGNPVFEDSSAYMHFNNSTFNRFSDSTQTALTNGALAIEGNVKIGSAGKKLKVGDGNPTHDHNILILTGASLEILPATTLIYANHS